MKTHNQIFLGLLLTLLTVTQLPAQCYNFSYEYLDGNKANARFSCGAERFWDLVANASYEVPRGSGKNVSFAASMWAGGRSIQLFQTPMSASSVPSRSPRREAR